MQHDRPPLGLGLASVVLGAVGLMLFLLPVLAIPISACGLAVGLVGAAAWMIRQSIDGRLAFAGVMLSSLALAIDVAIAYAPSGYQVRPGEPPANLPALPRHHIAPPAPFDRGAASGLLANSLLCCRWT